MEPNKLEDKKLNKKEGETSPAPAPAPEGNRSRKVLFIFLLVLAVLVLLGSGILLARYLLSKKSLMQGLNENAPAIVKLQYLRIYYPLNGHLEMEERTAREYEQTEEIARAVLEEFLKGPAGMVPSYIPSNTKVLNVFSGSDGILYVDLSDEFRRNFQGDALSEYLLLRGIYESLLSNLKDVQDVKLLIEEKEVESIGGHIYANLPLGQSILKGGPQVAK